LTAVSRDDVEVVTVKKVVIAAHFTILSQPGVDFKPFNLYCHLELQLQTMLVHDRQKYFHWHTALREEKKFMYCLPNY
jgi:hypothetical protein